MYELICAFTTQKVCSFVFESQFLLEYYTQRAKNVTNYKVSQAL